MSKGKGARPPYRFKDAPPRQRTATLTTVQEQPAVTSFHDVMEDGREYASITEHANINVDLASDIRRALANVAQIRGRPTVIYAANVKNSALTTSRSIDNTDDSPFDEMIRSIPEDEKEIDFVLITPGGSADKVARFVHLLRSRFTKITFILPYLCMSAGTIFCMSGDEIIMTDNACIGPIDPQVPSKNGRWVPAQAIVTLISEIQARGAENIRKGQQPDWTDVFLLNNMDPREIGNAHTASNLSTNLVTQYLYTYKFKDWLTRESSGIRVTDEYKRQRATEIARDLCDHAKWMSHSREITRDMVQTELKLKVVYPETIEGLERAIRRLWAILSFSMENTTITKIFFTENYTLFRAENIQQKEDAQ